MREDALCRSALGNQHLYGSLLFFLWEFISCTDATLGHVHVVERYQWNFTVICRMTVVGSLTPKCFNAVGTPVPVREVVNAVPVNFFLCGLTGLGMARAWRTSSGASGSLSGCGG